MSGCDGTRFRLVAIGLAAGLACAAATAETLPGPASAPTTLAEPAVEPRFGVHPGYDRLVLEWPEAVKASLASEHGIATLRFDRPVRLDLDRLDRLVAAEMRPVRLAADGTALTFRIPPGRHLVDHSGGNLVVIDLVTGSPDTPPSAEVAGAPPVATAPAAPNAAAPPVLAVAPELPTAPSAASAEIASAEAAAEQEAAATAPLEPLSDPALIGETTDHSLEVRTSPLDDGFSLRFEWRRPVDAAVFQLGSTAWVVFGHAVRLHMNPLPTDAARAVTMMQAPNTSATVLRVVMPPNDRLIAGRAGNTWLVDIRRQAAADTISETPGMTPLRPERGFYATPDPGRPVTVVDADTGEVLIAVPLPTPGQGFDQTLDYKSYHAVTTVQGLLFRPQTDAIQFEIVQGGVRVITPPPNTLATQ